MRTNIPLDLVVRKRTSGRASDLDQLFPVEEPLDPPPPEQLAGDPGWSLLVGAITGGVAAALVLYLGMFVRPSLAEGLPPEWAAVVVGAGAAMGAVFGRVTRRLTKVIPRVAFGSIEAGALWLALYAFVLARFAPGARAAIPFGVTAVGALIYGACVGAVPPVRVRYERGRRV
ncbi:MAG: hypothetical protein ACRENE_08795 [Polyangiaceae bacterium]